MPANVICFDLEGPLSPQDNAYEVMGLIEEGHKIFEVLSRYDDILTLEGKQDYEPGDTLALIVPFLLYHGISEEDIEKVSDKAKMVAGVDYTVSKLKSLGWEIFIISTSYQQHAFNVGRKIGISKNRIYCTKFPLDKYRQEIRGIDFPLVRNVENDILEELYPNPDNNSTIKKRLDKFFYKDILKTKIGKFMNRVKVIGGQRKVDAVYRISERTGTSPDKIVAVGDSITDYKMLNEVKSKGGLSIVFNGNEYAVPYASVGMASTDMRFILIVLDAYMQGGKEKVMETVNSWERGREKFLADPMKIPEGIIPDEVADFLTRKQTLFFRKEKCLHVAEPFGFRHVSEAMPQPHPQKKLHFIMPYLHCLEGIDEKKQGEIIEIHKRFRKLVRGDAAKLG